MSFDKKNEEIPIINMKDNVSNSGAVTPNTNQPVSAPNTNGNNNASSPAASTGKEEAPSDPRIPFYLFFNAASSIGIVFTNKLVFQMYNFKFGTLLTLIHFIFTYLGLEVCRFFGVFEKKDVSFRAVLPLCIAFCGFVALTNVSLVYNSVGFYQLMKVLTTPMIVFIQTMWYNETFSLKIKLSLFITCIGVAIGTVTDTEANLIGTIVALSALLITSLYQIWVGTKQKELECNPYQLLYWQAPISALLLIPCVPVLDLWLPDKDPNAPPKEFEMPSSGAMGAIFASSVLAFLVNLSIFLVIGKTSPVTYNVLGHFKLCVILSLGFMFFGNPLDYRNLTGIAITLAGVFWYTHLKQTKQ